MLNANILRWIVKFSLMFNVDPAVTLSVVQVESHGNPNTVGGLGEIGLMQLRPEYFGTTRKELFDPKTNIRLGVQFLSKIQNQCKHKLNFTYVVCYNLGVAGGNRIKHPTLFPYYRKVKKAMSEITPGQKAMILAIYYGGIDGEGTVLRKARDNSDTIYRNKWWVEVDGTEIAVEPERIVSFDKYFARRREDET